MEAAIVSRLGPLSRTGGARRFYRRWILATAAGELVGFSVPAIVGAATVAADVSQPIQTGCLVAAGLCEGALLGYAQSVALRSPLPELRTADWVLATAAGAGVAWVIGMAPSTVGDQLSEIPLALLIPLGVLAGALMLVSIGTAQALVLRRHLARTRRWVGANALAWIVGLAVVFAALALAPSEEPVLVAAFGLAGGVGMGAVVGAITGRSLLSMLDSPGGPPRKRAGRKRLRIALNHAHAWLYRHSGGRVLGRMGGQRILLLATTGRRSGARRTTPVQCQEVDGRLVIVASNSGSPTPPAWYANLRADPDVEVLLGGELTRRRARVADEAERAELWARMTAANRWLSRAQQRAGRTLPLVVLERRD